MLLVRSYRTFAPLPLQLPVTVTKKLNNYYCSLSRRYFSVALSSRSHTLGVIQQVWSFGSPDFPQTGKFYQSATTLPTLSLFILTCRESACFLWQICAAHEIAIALASSTATFIKSPDDKTLTSATVSSRENAWNAGRIFFVVRFDITASVSF